MTNSGDMGDNIFQKSWNRFGFQQQSTRQIKKIGRANCTNHLGFL